jgi:hypothetical protein
MTHLIITAEEARTLRGHNEADASGRAEGSDFAARCMIRDLAATVEALHAEVDRLRDIERWAGGLLARIHRDGGHHINDVGWEQAFLDADDRVVEWLGRCKDAALEAAP